MSMLKQLHEKIVAKHEQVNQVFEESMAWKDGHQIFEYQKATADWLGADTLALDGEAKSDRVFDLVHERAKERDEILSLLAPGWTNRSEAMKHSARLATAEAALSGD